MKVQLAVVEWQPRGQILVLDGAKEGSIDFAPTPFVEVQGDPLRVIWCHPADEKQVREALAEDSEVHLVE